MARRFTVRLALALLLPTTALGEPPPDPNLHVDPALEDCSVAFAPNLTQGAFRRFVREFGSVSAFKQGGAPMTLGRWGFAVDVEQIYFRVEEHDPAWNDTFYHPTDRHPLGASKSFPKLRLRLGVTDNLDVGAYYTLAPEANYGWLGVEAKYALLRQDEDQPITLAVRGAYTKTLYVTAMDMHALGVGVSAGHTFWKVLTPYLGIGAEAVHSRETSAAVDLRRETLVVPNLLVGLELRTWHLALGVEAQVSALTTYQAQVSATF